MQWPQTFHITRRHLLAIAVLAFLLRLAFILYTNDDSMVFNGWRWSDEGAEIAVNMLQGKGYVMSYSVLRDAQSFRMPVLPLFLFGVWSIFGYNLLVAKVLLAVVSSTTCVMAALLARRLFSDFAALVAGLLCAVLPGFIYWSATLGAETFTTFFLITGIYFLAGFEQRRNILFAALAIGLLMLTRPVFMPYAALAAGFVFWRAPAGKKVLWTAAFSLIIALLLMPWVVRNWSVHGTLAVTSTEGGVTFLESNNPVAFHENGGEQVLGYAEAQDEVQQQSRQLRELQLDRWMFRKGLAYVAADPLAYAGSFFQRIWYMWRPLPRLVAGGFSGRHVVVMLMTWLPVFLFALYGIVGRRVWRQGAHIPVWLVLAWVTFAAGMIRGSIRYRAPLEPLIATYAAAGIELLLLKIRLPAPRPQSQTIEEMNL